MSQPSSSLPVLVLGATGLVGAHVAARLAADGFPVRGLARHPERARLPPGVDCLAGDALDPAALAAAVRGCRAVCLCLPWELEVAAAEALALACAGSGAHLVYLSGLTITPGNAGSPMVDAKLRAEAVLAATGLPLTVFKPSWFLEALPRFVRDGRATLFGRPALPYRLVALDEYAALVSAALAGGARGVRTVVVEGPEAVALPDALQAYCDAVQPGLKVQVLPVWLGRALAWLSRSAELEAAVALLAYFARVERVSPEAPAVTRTGLTAWLARLPGPAGEAAPAGRSGLPAR